jgi:hypothetical protein
MAAFAISAKTIKGSASLFDNTLINYRMLTIVSLAKTKFLLLPKKTGVVYQAGKILLALSKLAGSSLEEVPPVTDTT